MRNLPIFLVSIFFFACSSTEDSENPIENNPEHLNQTLQYGEIEDIEGNVYKTIQIRSFIWMAENLRTSKFCNGDPIPLKTSNSDWVTSHNEKKPAYSLINNDQTKDYPYGKLYNWYAVSDSKNICPCGWRVPSDIEWKTMIDSLGSNTGGKLKTSGGNYWNSPNEGATNESGFSGLPSGSRWETDGSFNLFGKVGGWWTSNNIDAFSSWIFALTEESSGTDRGGGSKGIGVSVRCIKNL
jgi:uncharacterized protein (TIGR02145 family)